MSERARLAAVVAAGLAIVCIYAYPGYVAYDSLDQLRQARAGVYSDWHPPLMSALWRLLDHLVSGPLLMLLLQCGLFVGGTYALLRRQLSARRATIATLLVIAFPPNLTMMAVIVKDSLITGLFLAGAAGITSERRWPRVLGVVAFGVAAALRHNAISMTLPILAFLCPWPARRGPWLRGLVGAALALALTGAAFVTNRALTDVETHPLHGMLVPMDVVGTLARAPDLTDSDVKELMPGVAFVRSDIQAYARAHYNVNALALSYAHGDDRLYDDPTTPEARSALLAGWWHLVRTYPAAYLGFRFDTMRDLLGFADHPWTPVYEARNEKNMLAANGEPPAPRNVVQRFLARQMIKLGYTSVLFRPYLYLLLAIGLLWLMRKDRVVVALLAGGFGLLALDIFVIPAADIRYAYWLMVAVTYAVAQRLFSLHRRRPAVPFDH